MGIDHYFVCNECNKDVYGFRNGRVIPSEELNDFLSEHIYNCSGSLCLIESMSLIDINDNIPKKYLNKSYFNLTQQLKEKDTRISYLENKIKNIETPQKEYIEVDRNASLKLTIQQQEIHIKSIINEMIKLNNYIDELKKEAKNEKSN